MTVRPGRDEPAPGRTAGGAVLRGDPRHSTSRSRLAARGIAALVFDALADARVEEARSSEMTRVSWLPATTQATPPLCAFISRILAITVS
ncbi:hypothetical protein [Streptomyces boncukensis]|uniref:Uncharacterized protein n=1 Tax=Streptomyces boncukensis TaxID=2711219 RepID=A0A6G4WTB4_9ACTN|nr:hypothetical protein [Streptomyces boncukensis]NGO67784.1 hypothetical protein [Streptomyces boncukensis]